MSSMQHKGGRRGTGCHSRCTMHAVLVCAQMRTGLLPASGRRGWRGCTGHQAIGMVWLAVVCPSWHASCNAFVCWLAEHCCKQAGHQAPPGMINIMLQLRPRSNFGVGVAPRCSRTGIQQCFIVLANTGVTPGMHMCYVQDRQLSTENPPHALLARALCHKAATRKHAAPRQSW